MSELYDVVRDVVADGGDVWATLTGLGLTAVGVAEDAGGSGGGPADLVEIAQALGEHGETVPFAEHVTALWAVTGRGGPAPELVTVAIRDTSWQLVVPWASRATLAVVVDPAGVHLLDLRADGVVVRPGTDPAGRPLDDVEAPSTAFAPLSDVDPAAVSARLALLRCASVVGAARAAYRLTAAHVAGREQFGRPLVRLPTVATALARIRVQVLQAEIALDSALAAAGTPRARAVAAAGRIVCATVATEVCRATHQLHGAIGITAEYRLHHLTRLLWAERDADRYEERWATELGELVLDGGERLLWQELTEVG